MLDFRFRTGLRGKAVVDLVGIGTILDVAEKLRGFANNLAGAERSRRLAISELLSDVATTVENISKMLKQDAHADIMPLAAELEVYGDHIRTLLSGVLPSGEPDKFASQIAEAVRTLKSEGDRLSYVPALGDLAGRLRGMGRLLRAPRPRIPQQTSSKDFWLAVKADSGRSETLVVVAYIFCGLALIIAPPLFGIAALIIAVIHYFRGRQKIALIQGSLAVICTLIGVSWGYYETNKAYQAGLEKLLSNPAPSPLPLPKNFGR
jgi:hypothetical protein